MEKIVEKNRFSESKTRYPIIDIIRGIAVLLMIIFHLYYDLNLTKFVTIDFRNNQFWYLFPRVIVFLFLFCSGLSLSVSHQKKFIFKKLFKRVLKISIWAIIISIITYFMFPDRWIYFGTLHCIAVCTLFAIPFKNRPILSIIVAAALFIPSMILDYNLPWIKLAHPSMDYISPFPWIGSVLIGIFLFHKGIHRFSIKNSRPISILKFLGQNSLPIYIVHQPILFGLTYLLRKLL